MYTQLMAKIVPFSEARANLTELLDDVVDKQEHVLITRNGRPSAVVLSAAEYESLEETLDILQDKDLVEALRKSEDDVRAARLNSLDDLRKRVADRSGPTDPASHPPLRCSPAEPAGAGPQRPDRSGDRAASGW
jgi:antitoxin YefM